MAPSVKLHFFAANDVNGSLLHEITDEDDYFKSLKLKVERDGLGGAELLLARTVGFSPFATGTFRAESFVRLIIPAYSSTTYYPWGFFLNKRQQVVVHVDEKGGEEFKLGGPGPKQYLSRHALGISQATGTGANLDLENGIWRWNEHATVGRILDRILQEDAALNNPSLPDLTYTFDNIDDSASVNWVDDDIAGPGEFEIPIGTDFLKILWDLDNFVELTSWIDLGTVASPKFELNIIQGIGDDNTGSAVGAGVCLLKEGVNIANDALVVEGASLRQASHVLVEGKDGVWVQAVRTGYSPGDYTKREKISFTRTSNEAWLEAVGKRWLDRQDNGEKEVTVEIVPGQSDNTGLYFPAPNRVLWLSNLISVESAADGTSQTALDLDAADPQLVTGFELETHQAADDSDSTALAQSWDVKVKLNIERSGNVEKTPDQRSSIRTEYVNKLQLCVSLDCDDIDASTSPAVTVTNGNAENAAGGQWSGGAYTTAKFHAGARAYQDAAVAVGDLLYTFSGVTFLAGTRYVFDFWRRLTIDHDRTEVTVGDTGAGDTESRSFIGLPGADPTDVWLETAVGADGATWNRGRICWTPTANTTAVTFRFVSTSFSAGDHAIDDLSCVTAAAADELAGNDSRAARCDHGHLVESLPTAETDTSLRLAPDGSGGVEWSTGGSGGAPTTADYLVGTAQGGLSAEIVVGTTPGGELGGTWASPTVDATHSGSAHHAESHESRHQDGGADEIDITTLGGYSGNSSQVLLGDGTFASPPAAGAGDFSGLTTERRIQAVSDYVAAYDSSAADERGFPVGSLGMSRQHTVIETDMAHPESGTLANLGSLHDAPLVWQFTGNGAAPARVDSVAGRIGLMSVSTGTTATGRCGLSSAGDIAILGGGKVRFMSIGKLNTLSTGTERYGVYMGLGNAMGGTAQASGVGFRYTDNVNGGEWQAVTTSASVESTLDTNVAADTNYHVWEFEVNAAASSVEFWIDGTSVGTLSTNIPSVVMRCIAWNMVKSIGTTARLSTLDAFQWVFEYTTAR